MLITQVAQLCLIVLTAAAMPRWSHLSTEVKQHCAWMGDRLETSVQLAGIIDAAQRCAVNVNLGFPSGGCKA